MDAAPTGARDAPGPITREEGWPSKSDAWRPPKKDQESATPKRPGLADCRRSDFM